jgi:hypothetical protein
MLPLILFLTVVLSLSNVFTTEEVLPIVGQGKLPGSFSFPYTSVGSISPFQVSCKAGRSPKEAAMRLHCVIATFFVSRTELFVSRHFSVPPERSQSSFLYSLQNIQLDSQ